MRSRAGLTLSITVVGSVEPERLATRAGARPGDLLVVTGTLGDSAAGCAALLAGPQAAERVPPSVLEAHRLPQPRIAEARAAVATGAVTALMDISDGLAGDLHHICEESGVGAVLDAGTLPLSEACRDAAARLRLDPLQLALTGGEDSSCYRGLTERVTARRDYRGDRHSGEHRWADPAGGMPVASLGRHAGAFAGEGFPALSEGVSQGGPGAAGRASRRGRHAPPRAGPMSRIVCSRVDARETAPWAVPAHPPPESDRAGSWRARGSPRSWRWRSPAPVA